ncbi:MAG: alpha/beta fold hydrolase [Deltaproteobacteria bacterium]|nr:alpha/beta fold hydrolase [Deltaproteobacteria bacterium]
MDLAHTLYEPEGDGPHPTIVALHGWGASAFDLMGLAPYFGGGRFQVICPQGPLEVPLGMAGAVGFGWFPLSATQPAIEGPVEDAAARLERFLETVLARYAVDRRKLVLLGFSQGGVLAYRLALAAPRRFAGLVALSSWLPPQMAAALPAAEGRDELPTLVQHGTADEIIAVARAQQSIETLRTLRVPASYREYDMGHEISAESLADLSQWLEDKVRSPIILA